MERYSSTRIWTINLKPEHQIKLMKRLLKDDSGAIYEFLAFILFLALVLGLLIPLAIELFIYNNQAQELDRITKMAATRACSLMADPDLGIASDVNQGSLGFGTDISVMQPLVNSVFKNETAHPSTYFENTKDKVNIDLKIFDFLGKEIDIRSKENWIKVTDNEGNSSERLLVGTNTDTGLCPSGGDASGEKGWKYCLTSAGDDAAKEALADTGMTPDTDLVARMEKLQPGRCRTPGDPKCQSDFRNRIDRCSVCATKSRESIFSHSIPLLGEMLLLRCDPNKPNQLTVLPCKMSACASARFVQYNGKRGYAPKYRDKMNLGSGTFTENSPYSQTAALSSETGPSTNPGEFFCGMNKNGDSGVFNDAFGGQGCQSQPTTDDGSSGNTEDDDSSSGDDYGSSGTGSSGGSSGTTSGGTSGITSGGSSGTTSGTTSGVTSGTTSGGTSGITSGTTSGSTTTIATPEQRQWDLEKAALDTAHLEAIRQINEAHKQHSIDITNQFRSQQKLGTPEHLAAVNAAIAEQKALLAQEQQRYESALDALGPRPTTTSGTTTSGTTTSGTTTSGTTTSGTTTSGTTAGTTAGNTAGGSAANDLINSSAGSTTSTGGI